MIRLVLAALLSSMAAQLAPSWARPATPNTNRIRLFIRGDDFGYTHSSNVALRQAAAAQIMRSASLMPVGPWFAEAAEIARSHSPLSVGLHLTITSEWYPLRWGPRLDAAQVPTLVSPDGYFFKNFWKDAIVSELDRMPSAQRTILGRLVTDKTPSVPEVEAELRAQITLARRVGLRIDYLDCHMGAACLPALRGTIIKLAAELCVPIPEHDWMGHREVGFPISEDSVTTIERFRTLLEPLQPGLYRVVLHPAEDSDELRAVDMFEGIAEARKRQAALDALTSARIKAVIEARNIELLSVSDLWDKAACRLR